MTPASPGALDLLSSGSALAETPNATVDEFAGLRAAVEAAEHQVRREEGHLVSMNRAQGWITTYDDDGALTGPTGGGLLSLASWGYTGSSMAVCQPCGVTADGNRVTLAWDGELSEWWINDRRGLEHGMTLLSPPSSKGTAHGATLDFVLDVRGNLIPEVYGSGRGARFMTPDGGAALTYSGLLAFDATGRDLPVWMEAGSSSNGHQLTLRVSDEGAVYPITVDPVSRNAFIKASNPGRMDKLGESIAVSGNTVVVGATGEASHATGVDGDQSNDSALFSGAAYVFERTGGVWSQQAYLKASNTDPDDNFGASVAISGDTIAVGAFAESGASSGINGAETTNSSSQSGAVYIFSRAGTAWSQTAYIKGPNSDALDRFGTSLALSGDRLAVGASGDASSSSGVGGDPADNGLGGSGAVHTYTRTGSVWSHEVMVKASNPDANDAFGAKVALQGDTLVVGAINEASTARGVGGDQTNNTAPNEGAVYVFRHDGNTWAQEGYLKSTFSNLGNGQFGTGLDIDGNTIVVGAPFESGSPGPRVGAAYLYERTGSTWSATERLTAQHRDQFDSFGLSVAILGDTIVVGAPGEESTDPTIDGDQTNNDLRSSGACYVFTKIGPRWLQQSYLKAGVSMPDQDAFGISVALSTGLIFGGAPCESSGSSGINGDESDNSIFQSGAMYAFNRVAPGTIGTNFCSPMNLNSSMTRARITATGSAVVSANNLTLTVSGLPTTGTTALLIAARNPTVTIANPVSGGVASNGRLCIASARMGRDTANMYMGSAGTFSRTLDLANVPFPASPGVSSAAVMAGETWYWQCWYRDGIGGRSDFSDAIQVMFQ